DGRADGQPLVEKAKGVLEELLPLPRRDRAGDQLARGAADLQMDVLLARIEAGEGGVGERRTDVQSGLAGPGARLRDGEGLADLGRQRRGRRWHHHGRGGRHWRGGRGGHGRGRGGGRGGHGRGRDGGRRGGGPARGRGARARARPRRGRG